MARPLIPPAPLEPAALQAWAEEHEVTSFLDRSILHLPGPVDWGYRARLTYMQNAPSLRELLDPEFDRRRLGRSFDRRLFDLLVLDLRAKLRNLAQQFDDARQASLAKMERWSRARRERPLPDALGRLVEGLLALRMLVRSSSAPTDPQQELEYKVVLTPRPLSAIVTSTVPRTPWIQSRVEFDLVGGPQAPAVRCAVCGPSVQCPHEIPAIDALLDCILPSKPGPGLDDGWVTELARPSWERFLDAPASPADEGDEEVRHGYGATRRRSNESEPGLLSWRIHVEEALPAIEVIHHKPLKSGGWSKGVRVAPDSALQRPAWHSTPADARALELLVGFVGSGGSPFVAQRLLFRALDLLAGHPQVYFVVDGDRWVPLHLERGSLAVQVERTADGTFVPTARLAGSSERAQEALKWLGVQRPFALIVEHPPQAATARGFLVEANLESLELLRSIQRFRPQIPAEAAPQLMARLAPAEAHLALHLPPELEGEALPPDLQPVLRLKLEAPVESSTAVGAPGALELEVLVRPLAGGPAVVPGEGPEELARFEGARRLRVHRDLAGEVAAAEALLARLPLANAQSPTRWQRRLASLNDALDLIAHLQSLPTEGPTAVKVEWLQAPPRLTRQAGTADLRVQISDQRDWFGLTGEVEVDGERVKLALLLEAIRRQARYVQVGPNRWVALSRELTERLAGAADVVHGGRQGLEVSPVAADALSDLLDAVGELKVSARWKGLVKRLDAARTRVHPLPRGIKAKLRPYQVEGFGWLMRLAECGMGAVLADDMGLGKTLQALAMLLARAEEGPALVVAPTSVAFNWQREAERFAPDLEICRYHGPAEERGVLLMDLQPGEVVITSYGLLVEDAEAFQKVTWATVVLDEAQALKNAATLRARTVRDLQATWSVALTGTPVENHLGELWSLFRAVAPGLLGSWDHFRDRFATPIEKNRDPVRRAALAKVVRPFILRRTKVEVAPELPSRTEIQLPITLSRGERRLYDDARLAALAQLTGAVEGDEGGDRRFQVLAALTRLRQLACHPRLYDPESGERSSKLEKLLELIEELREEGHRALVFSQFTSHLALVREALDAQKIAYRYLDGSTRPKDREAAVDAFQKGEGDLFLISLKAGGTGLNLTGADYVIHLDPWWNPAVEDQATDRAHRIGQTKPVTVYRLVTQGTIEESILAMHADKRDLVAGLLEGTDRAGKLSTEQLVNLIRTGAADVDDETRDDSPGDAVVRAEKA